ncbi:hypothetical protein QYE76_048869 [Lolium multiflorum]|uniref:DUF4218 domain-containing protein n=1 Tax=Lolium multiflorum TaxID=4521 RepID=A0AAD8SMQ6_LOLMU|nr:hypothetical protein QYE76_048869 [Lolium multiflorum]
MTNYSEWHTERAPQGKKVNSVEETSSLSDKIDMIMSMLVNGRSNVDPNNVPLASLVAQEEHVDVNFIKNNNFNNNAYRNNSGNNYRPYPSNNSNGYGSSYNNSRSVPSGLEVMLKEFISTQTAFNKSVEEKLGKIDILASKVDSLAADVDLLKLKIMPNEDKDIKSFATANAIQVRINENIRLMAELHARWEREEKLAKENNVVKVWTITTTSNDDVSHVAKPPSINGKIIGVGNVSTPSAKRAKLPETAKTAETACDKTAEIFQDIGDNDPIALDHNGLDFDDCHISEVIKFLQKLARSPNASAINLAFTKHITNALIKGIVNQHLLRYSFMEGHTQWMSDDGDDDIDGDGDDDGGDDDNEGDGEDAPHDNGEEVEEDGAHVDGDQEGREEHAADEDMSRNTPLTAAVQDRHVQELLLSNTSTDPKIAGRRKAKLDQLEVDSRTPLYDAARGTEESRLRYALDIMEMKAKHKWTDTSVDELFGYLKIHFPKDNTCAGSLQEAKKIVCPLDLPHQKYHACISDCVIYRNEHANLDTCPQCGESRYKRGTRKSPRKVVWYFPLTPRLQRYFVDPKEAKLMRWHAERKEAVMRDVERVENPVLTHPSDASQWKTLDDEYYEEFGKEPRNIRLGASTDGLNPFGNQSSKHSTWPVFVWMYNLPPWLCLKKKYIHMSMLIQGPTQPGSDINLYLELLKEELVTLWEEGTETWDAYGQETFRMKAALLTTVQDYLGYGYIACQVCHGHKACVRCMEKTPFLQLGKDPGSSKTVYMRHRMWLPKNDPWRKRGDLFNGKDEVEGPPPRRSSEEIDTLLKNWKDCPPAGKIKIQKRKKGDKRKKKKKEPGPLLGVWKRRSVFWDLPYWKILGTPHSLDVMHITKNVCESLLGTVLNMPERTKDGSKARHDLMALDIRKELHFAQVDQETEEEETDGRKRKRVAKQRETPRPSCFTLNPDELEQFFKCLLEVKFPLGYAGLIRRWLDPTKKIFSGMKSHDCHVMMTQILPVAIRGIMEPHVRATLTDLCNVFDVITRKSITVKKLGRLQEEIVTILCEMEMYFPPAFFDIMVHLLVHIVDDIEDLGPAFLHNMMALERMNGFIKGYVRNRAHPDGSIVQGFLTEECISFCKNYLNEDDPRPVGLPANKHLGRFEGVGHNAGRRELDVDQDDRRTDFNRAHLVALQHMNEVEPWVDQHINMIKSRADKPMTEQEVFRAHNSSFASWFKDQIDANPPPMASDVDKMILALSYGPAPNLMTYQKYDINGYTFSTEERDKKSDYQNSGVTMESYMGEEKKRYYGRIEEIWELDYVGEKLPMFRVRWATDVTKEDAYVTTMRLPPKSKTKNPTAQNEPWVLAKHVEQCFFITDPSRPSRVVVRRGKRALVGMDGVADEQDFDGLVGDPMMEEPDEDDRTYTLRRRRTTLPRSSVPPYTRSRDDTGGVTRTKRKGL